MDIEQQQFGRSFRGYNEEEVDNFLDRIAKDYEEVINENLKYKEEVKKLQIKLEEYTRMDKTLRSALVSAQQSAANTKENVEKEAQVIIDKAKMQAEQIKTQAKQDLYDIKNEIEALRRRKFLLLEKLKNTLKLYIKMLDEEKQEETSQLVSNQVQDKALENLKMKMYSNKEQESDDEKDSNEYENNH